MLFSIINFVFNDRFPFPNGPEGAFAHLGFPPYFKVELTIAKILGVLALVIPAVPLKVKEFAYAGFAITLMSAAIAHFGRGDARNLSVLYVVDPLVFSVCWRSRTTTLKRIIRFRHVRAQVPYPITNRLRSNRGSESQG